MKCSMPMLPMLPMIVLAKEDSDTYEVLTAYVAGKEGGSNLGVVNMNKEKKDNQHSHVINILHFCDSLSDNKHSLGVRTVICHRQI